VTAASPLQANAWPVGAFTRPSVVREWLRAAGLRPNRLLGQNFLIDGNILQILLDTAQIQAGDRVLEIGPGLGALTAGLLSRGASVVAIEKDARLIPLLQEHLPDAARVRILEGDALDLAEPLLLADEIQKVVANLPYTPGTRILVELATSPARPARLTVMVQEEVAGRLAAAPGSTAFGLLSLWCRIFHAVTYVKRVSPNCFWPRPQVQSAIVQLDRLPQPLLPENGWPYFRYLSRCLFQQRRKQLGHLLSMLYPQPSGAGKKAVELLPEACRHLRPEALPLDAWCMLAENMRMHFGMDDSRLPEAEGDEHGW